MSSPFWPITALAISMTNGAAGLSPFADPLSPAGPAVHDMSTVAPSRIEVQCKSRPRSEKAVEETVEKAVDNYRRQDWIGAVCAEPLKADRAGAIALAHLRAPRASPGLV